MTMEIAIIIANYLCISEYRDIEVAFLVLFTQEIVIIHKAFRSNAQDSVASIKRTGVP